MKVCSYSVICFWLKSNLELKAWKFGKTLNHPCCLFPHPPSPQENCSKFIIPLNLGLNLTKITSKTSYSWRAFPEFPWKHLFLILLNSQWQNCSIFNKSYMLSVNIIEPHQCTPPLLTRWRFFSCTKRSRWMHLALGDLNMTNKTPSLINRCYCNSCLERTLILKSIKYLNKNIECNILLVR